MADPPAAFVTDKSETSDTPKTAVAVRALLPTEVVKDPEGIVLVSVPETELVTTVETEQLEPGGINAPTERVSVPRPAVAVATPVLQLVCAIDVALSKFVG